MYSFRKGLFYKTYGNFSLFLFTGTGSAMILITLIFNGITVAKLKSTGLRGELDTTATTTDESDPCETESKASKSKAAMTVIALASIFCITNFIAIMSILLTAKQVTKGQLFAKGSVGYEILDYLGSVMFPLNSALNPIVYIARKHGLRLYVKNTLRTIKSKYYRMTVLSKSLITR